MFVCLALAESFLESLTMTDSVLWNIHTNETLSEKKLLLNKYITHPQDTTLENISRSFKSNLGVRVGGSYIVIHNHRIQSKVTATTPVVAGGESLFYLRHRPRLVRELMPELITHAVCMDRAGWHTLFVLFLSLPCVSMILCVLGYSIWVTILSQPGGIKCGVKTVTCL